MKKTVVKMALWTACLLAMVLCLSACGTEEESPGLVSAKQNSECISEETGELSSEKESAEAEDTDDGSSGPEEQTSVNQAESDTGQTSISGTSDDTEQSTEEEQSEEEDIMAEFYISEIDDTLFARMWGKSYKENCTVPREDLRYLHIMHWNFDNELCEGEMVCSKYIAEDVLEIFKELYQAGYQIDKVRLVDEYDADDERSMADDNSSAFNFRYISYTTTISKHGLGMAVDINTLYNPYVKQVNGATSIEPANAGDYVDRSRDFAHKIDENDLAYQLFTEHGFEWGGSWSHSKDYQHFEVPTWQIQEWYPDY